ncbi:MAG: hypothetical protein ACJA2W_001664 [Planctomycetota bacterium]
MIQARKKESQHRAPKIACPSEVQVRCSDGQCLTVFTKAQPLAAQRDIAAAEHSAYPFVATGIQNDLCVGEPNSSQQRSYLFAELVPLGAASIRLRAERLPPSVFGYFLASRDAGAGVMPPLSEGTLCLGYRLWR